MTEIDPQELKLAQERWEFFMKATTYTCVAVVVVLALMALFLT